MDSIHLDLLQRPAVSYDMHGLQVFRRYACIVGSYRQRKTKDEELHHGDMAEYPDVLGHVCDHDEYFGGICLFRRDTTDSLAPFVGGVLLLFGSHHDADPV